MFPGVKKSRGTNPNGSKFFSPKLASKLSKRTRLSGVSCSFGSPPWVLFRLAFSFEDFDGSDSWSLIKRPGYGDLWKGYWKLLLCHWLLKNHGKFYKPSGKVVITSLVGSYKKWTRSPFRIYILLEGKRTRIFDFFPPILWNDTLGKNNHEWCNFALMPNIISTPSPNRDKVPAIREKPEISRDCFWPYLLTLGLT